MRHEGQPPLGPRTAERGPPIGLADERTERNRKGPLLVRCGVARTVEHYATARVGMKHATSWDDAFLKYAPEPSDGCWYWMGNIRNGYGRIAFRQSLLYAHRYAYERLHGPIPDGMTVDHMCHNEDPNCPGGKPCMHRRCVNPAHLAIATSVINAGRAARIARTGRCTKGHKVSGDNVYVIRGLPNCRECHLARQHAYELRRDHKADIRAGGDGVVWAGVSR